MSRATEADYEHPNIVANATDLINLAKQGDVNAVIDWMFDYEETCQEHYKFAHLHYSWGAFPHSLLFRDLKATKESLESLLTRMKESLRDFEKFDELCAENSPNPVVFAGEFGCVCVKEDKR